MSSVYMQDQLVGLVDRNMALLPVVDFSSYGLDLDADKVDTVNLDRLGNEVVQGLITHGALYIRNHGFPSSLEDRLTNVSGEFFALPVDVKEQYSRSKSEEAYGYTAPEVENINPERPPGLKEAFNFPSKVQLSKNWPDKETPEIKSAVLEFIKASHLLMERVHKALAVGIGLKDKEFFVKLHNTYLQENNSSMRTLNYMPIPEDYEVKPGQIRCGEHTDFGTLTFIFQDSAGGLQVLNHQGEWIDANPIKGTILLLAGATLQRFTNSKIKAAEHRVVFPEDDARRHLPRRSHIFFSMPHDSVVVTPCNGEEPNYLPLDYKTYCNRRFQEVIFT